MKQKIVSAAVLTAVTLAVLFLAAAPAGQESGASDYAYYFRNNTYFAAGNGLEGDYFDFPWASEADLTDQADLLPELSGYSVTEATGRYLPDGSFWGLHV